MNKEELLKEIMKLPKIETNNSISAMNVINVDDLMSAVDRLNKIPDYNDLLKENQELKKQLEDANEKIILLQASEPMLEWKKELEENQQKEFIEWLEDYLNLFDNMDIEEQASYDTIEEILQKYKSIIGDINDKK